MTCSESPNEIGAELGLVTLRLTNSLFAFRVNEPGVVGKEAGLTHSAVPGIANARSNRVLCFH